MSRTDHLRVSADPGTGVVALTGELGFATAPALEEFLRGHLPDHPDLVLDVRALAACDTAGLAALIGATRRAELLGGGVTLVGVREPLGRLLRLTGVEELFAVGADPQEQAAFEGRGEPA